MKLPALASALAALCLFTGSAVAQQVEEERKASPTRVMPIPPGSEPTFPENPLPTGTVAPIAPKPLDIAGTIRAREGSGRKPVAFTIGGVHYDLRSATTETEKRGIANAMQEEVRRLAPGGVVVVWQEEDPPQARWPWGFSYEILPIDDNCLMQMDATDTVIQDMCFP